MKKAELYFKTISNLEWLDSVIEMDNRIMDSFIKTVNGAAKRITETMEACQSPIEKLLMIELCHFMFYRCDLVGPSQFTVLPQQIIKCDQNTYRVDFLITATKDGQLVQLVVECDGHDFHEKTKEQASRDKKRDRDLTLKGYKILRFTGKEIWADPGKCVFDIIMCFFKHKKHESFPG